MKKTDLQRRQQFDALLQQYNRVVAKVCYVYASENAPFDDLYQEVCLKLWQGIDSFRGEAAVSTWIYRTAINTCITWHRRNSRHYDSMSLEVVRDLPDSADGCFDHERYRQFQELLSSLEPLEKALITLWLDEKSYDDIALITGLLKSNVAVRIHRIKNKLITRGRSRYGDSDGN